MSNEKSNQIAFYKGYEIKPVPYQLADSGEWTVKIRIFPDCGDERRSREFSLAKYFKGRDEAVAHCFNFGKQIIDGKIENCTVDGL
ncbi:MAG TPA: HlyU family transcriptional regulator [Nitrospirales bacterium]|nr:HlyU family transcriptional regulator [Nitrospirales bacterium]